ncbi:putative cytochrome P450 [Helianthus annuus]|nr:putative cytochrome P450 [Helianthus annuus]
MIFIIQSSPSGHGGGKSKTNNQDQFACTILTISIPTLVLVWSKWTLSYFKDTTRLPPGPYGLPFVGYLPFLRNNLHERFTEMAHKYGPIFSLRLGSKLHVVVNSMDLVKVVARDMNQTFANRCPPQTVLAITYGIEVNVVTSMLWGCSKYGERKDNSYIGDDFREVELKIIELIGALNVSDFIPMLSRFDLQGSLSREVLEQ